QPCRRFATEPMRSDGKAGPSFCRADPRPTPTGTFCYWTIYCGRKSNICYGFVNGIYGRTAGSVAGWSIACFAPYIAQRRSALECGGFAAAFVSTKPKGNKDPQ